MNILLLSMPDSFEHMPTVAVRMPNGALTSLAGNVDQKHKVAVADLVLCDRTVRETVTRLVREFDPELVGLSVMTFQRNIAARIIHNPERAPHRLEDDEIRLPNRSARVLKGYTLLGRQVDVVETSRGCTYDCSFCSIIEMRGEFSYLFL
jgi:tRNA A37 methylthiotransferase MiaB